MFSSGIFSAGVETDRHGSAGAETGQQIVVWIGSGGGAADPQRFINRKPVLADRDFLKKSGRVAANDYVLGHRIDYRR